MTSLQNLSLTENKVDEFSNQGRADKIREILATIS